MGSLTLTLLHPLAACVHRFVDAEYHRTGFTLASGNDDKVRRKRGATESTTASCSLTPSALRAQLHDALLRLAAAAVSRVRAAATCAPQRSRASR
jgi:hypothetical protein